MSRSALLVSRTAGGAVMFLLAGCATPMIPEHVRQGVTPGLAFTDVLANPDAYRGKTVMWAGEVLDLTNEKDGTTLELLQVPCDAEGEPLSREKSQGRFMAFFGHYLDGAVYQPRRMVTIVGELQGKKQQVVGGGKLEYTYPLVTGRNIYLWPVPERRRPFDRYGWGAPPYWDPWWGFYYPPPAIVLRHREAGEGGGVHKEMEKGEHGR